MNLPSLLKLDISFNKKTNEVTNKAEYKHIKRERV